MILYLENQIFTGFPVQPPMAGNSSSFFAKHSTDYFSLNENGMTLIEPKMFPGRVGDQVTRP